MEYLLGIDIGTSSAKATIFSSDGKALSTAGCGYNFDVPQIGFAEQDPDVWWRATVDSISKALHEACVKPEEIRGIGLSGQMHGMVALDKNMRPVRKAILHCDVRSKKQAEEIREIFGPRFFDITCNPVFPGFQLLSLLWMRENEPYLFEAAETVVCPKDYVRYRLTGNIAAEATDASGTLAYDMKRQAWSDEILERLGVDKGLLPDPNHLPYEIAGTLSALAAADTGLAAGTPVVYGGGDQSMQSLGNGVCHKGIMTATIGTSGQVLCIEDNLAYNPKMNTHTMRHVERDSWFAMGAVLSAGLALNWFRRTLAPEASYEELGQEAQLVTPCCEGLAFFPCMMGERTPYMDAATRGMFFGLTFKHTRGHIVRSIMEGVTFAMLECINLLGELCDGSKKIICAGGGARSALWLQIQADIYGREVYVSNTPEQACAGAAIAAGVGCGLYGNLRQGCEALVSIREKPVEPIPENTKRYRDFYKEVYGRLYDQTHTLFPALSHY